MYIQYMHIYNVQCATAIIMHIRVQVYTMVGTVHSIQHLLNEHKIKCSTHVYTCTCIYTPAHKDKLTIHVHCMYT